MWVAAVRDGPGCGRRLRCALRRKQPVFSCEVRARGVMGPRRGSALFGVKRGFGVRGCPWSPVLWARPVSRSTDTLSQSREGGLRSLVVDLAAAGHRRPLCPGAVVVAALFWWILV